MNRKRLIGFMTALMLGLSVSPAAALGTSADLSIDELVEVLQEAEQADVVTVLDPEIDESIPGVGGLVVDVDESNQTLTVGIAIEPLGVDESITLGAPGGGDEAAADEALTPAQVEQAETKANMNDVKADAAQDAASIRRPAFATANSATDASGSVNSGTGVTGSTRAPAQTLGDGDNAAGALADGINNPILRILAVIVLAGTGTAWSAARRMGLAG